MNKGSFKERMTSYVQELVNPISYYDWINQNTTIQGIPFTCDRYPFQKAIINDMSQELHCIKPSQIGLPLSLKTPVFTTEGMKTLGEIKIGDYVYTPKGQKTKVVYLSPIQTDSPCYELTFCDGTKIIADENHRWFVKSDKAFNLHGLYKKSGRIPKDSDYARSGRITTKGIFENYKGLGGRKDSYIFYIDCTQAIQTKGYNLKVNPYFLGLWLGNGSRHTGILTTNKKHVDEQVTYLESMGLKVNKVKTGKPVEYQAEALSVFNAEGKNCLQDIFTELGTKEIQFKGFKPEWLLLSIEDRFELLRGLIDSDGNISKLGRVEFYNTSKELVEGFFQLAASLGFKPRIRTRLVEGLDKKVTLKNGQVIHSKKDIFACHFMAYADHQLSHLSSKQSNLKTTGRKTEAFRRRIVDVQPVAAEPVRCIMVDDLEHQFVCSNAFITTSNTEVQLRKALAYVSRNPHRNLIYTMPDENMRKRVFQNRVLPLLTQDSVFHGLNAAGKKPIRSIEITEINNSQMLMFPANEKAATSQPADVVFNDEIDLSDPQIIALFNSRLQGSDVKINHNYSTPTFQGIGIDALYETSDQHEYMFKCPHCGFYQLPEFTTKFIYIPGLPAEAPDDLSKFEPQWLDKYGINTLDARSICCKCGKQVTYGDEENHAWVPRHPHRSNSRGYRISPFSTRNLDAAYVFNTLMKYIRGDNMKGFQNTVLGKTHESSDERLSESLLRTLFTPNFDPIFDHGIQDPFFIGIDMGKICHVTIGFASSMTNVKTVLFETVKAEELEARLPFYFSKFNIKMGFIDRLPLITTSESVRDKSNKVIMPMQYELTSGGQMLTPKTDEYGNLSYVAAHRTMHLDRLASAVRSGFVEFSGYGSQKDTIIQHLRAMVRELKSDNSGTEKVPMWVKKDKNDHYFHSLSYLYQAVIQYYNGCSFLDDQGYNSTIFLGGMDNFLVPSNSLTLIGRK